jgi:hypothetical protein
MTMVHPTARAGATFPEFEVSFEARRDKKFQDKTTYSEKKY